MSGHFHIVFHMIRTLFRVIMTVFYHNVHLEGTANVPPPGVPTLLCFNHGNGLGDAMAVISSTSREVRFAAKDTLWRVPIIGHLIRWSRAVPVQRQQDHDTKIDNTRAIDAILDALAAGDLVAIAPEGISRFHSQLAPLKNGAARIAFELVQRNMASTTATETEKKNFRVVIVPCGLTYLHRAFWRSDVCVEYGDPIVVDQEYVREMGGSTKEVYAKVTDEIRDRLTQITLDSPNWETLTLAITCSRIYAPFGTNITLAEYVSVVRHFVKVFAQHAEIKEIDGVNIKSLYDQLIQYQQGLKACGVKDFRVLHIASKGHFSNFELNQRMFIRLFLAAILFILSAPGMILWSPTFYLSRRRERQLIARGVEQNYDTIMENSATIGFFSLQLTCFVCGVFFAQWTSSFSKGLAVCVIGIPLLLWLTVRLLEDGVASLGSFFSLWRLKKIDKRKLNALIKRRNELKESITKVAEDSGAPRVNPRTSRKPLGSFSLRGRQKKDWHEVLRLRDAIDFGNVGSADRWFVTEFPFPLEELYSVLQTEKSAGKGNKKI